MPETVPTWEEFQTSVTRLITLEGLISSLQSRVTILESEVNQLKARVTVLETERPPPLEPPIAILSGPSSAEGGMILTLTTSTTRAISATLNGNPCPLNGTVGVPLANETSLVTFTLQAIGETGLTDQDSWEVQVTAVQEPPIEEEPESEFIETLAGRIPNFGYQAALINHQDGNASDPNSFRTRTGYADRLQVRKNLSYDIPPEPSSFSINENGDE